MLRLCASVVLLAAALTGPALAQEGDARGNFVSFVDRVTEGVAALERKAREVADDISGSDEFELAERGVNDLRASVEAFAQTLGEKTDVDTLTADMEAWTEENRARIDELDQVSRYERARLRALWRRQDRIVEAIGDRLERVRKLVGQDLELLAEEKAIRMEMAKVGAERTSRRAQIRAAQEISRLARELKRVRDDIEEALDQLSPAS